MDCGPSLHEFHYQDAFTVPEEASNDFTIKRAEQQPILVKEIYVHIPTHSTYMHVSESEEYCGDVNLKVKKTAAYFA